jgi:hypothetical protein
VCATFVELVGFVPLGDVRFTPFRSLEHISKASPVFVRQEITVEVAMEDMPAWEEVPAKNWQRHSTVKW